MSPRVRVSLTVAVAVLAVAGSVLFVMQTRKRQEEARTQASPVSTHHDLSAVQGVPHIVFRNTALGQGYGQVAMVRLDDPGGRRAITPASCERVYADGRQAICLHAQRGLVTTYSSLLLNADWTTERRLPMVGLPSRARLSPDGSLVATTTFVYGDSYAHPGQFSTRTLISRTDGSQTIDVEQEFHLFVDGREITAIDRNYWGVTFADSDRFYATAASGGKTWLVEARISTRRMVAIREDVECPSLSPDGTRIAFKKHGDLPPGQWRLAVYDLRTGEETVLAETRSVDDQAEWLDNERVLYGLPRGGAGVATSDVWMVRADGTGKPELLIADAWSPSVVHPSP